MIIIVDPFTLLGLRGHPIHAVTSQVLRQPPRNLGRQPNERSGTERRVWGIL